MTAETTDPAPADVDGVDAATDHNGAKRPETLSEYAALYSGELASAIFLALTVYYAYAQTVSHGAKSVVSFCVAGYYMFLFLDWAFHLVLHNRRIMEKTALTRMMLKAHTDHHKRYTPKYMLTEYYASDNGHYAFGPFILAVYAVAWGFMPSAWLGLFLTQTTFLIISADTIHQQQHVRGSYLNRFQWFRKLKAVHRLHHVHTSKNLAFLDHSMDVIMGTFKNPPNVQ